MKELAVISLGQAEFPAKSREARVLAQAIERRLDAEKDQPRAAFLAGPLQKLQCATVVTKSGVDERQSRPVQVITKRGVDP